MGSDQLYRDQAEEAREKAAASGDDLSRRVAPKEKPALDETLD